MIDGKTLLVAVAATSVRACSSAAAAEPAAKLAPEAAVAAPGAEPVIVEADGYLDVVGHRR